MLKTEFQIRDGRYLRRFPVTLDIQESRIYFMSSPFALKDEIKSFKGCKWHGFDETNPRKIWSIENCPRNIFQIKALMGENVYQWWDQPTIELSSEQITKERIEYAQFEVTFGEHQADMVRRGLTYHYQIWAAEQGLGKSLSAIELMERSGVSEWWYVGPGSALESVKREIDKWNMDTAKVNLTTMNYEKLVTRMRYDAGPDFKPPQGIIFDETDLLKNLVAHRSIAAQDIADRIREQYGDTGYVILMSGTPSAKSPGDLWNQCEICWPGFLREGNFTAFQRRYGIMSEGSNPEGTTFQRLEGWNEEEVAKLPGRYKGLMTVYRKSDWLNLPEKQYVTEKCEPSEKVLRVARSLAHIAPNTITALTWLRGLSSGFQYQVVPGEMKTCTVCEGTGRYDNPEPSVCPCCLGKTQIQDYVRSTVMVETPKDDIVRKWLDKVESDGRIVLAASFQGSIDRLKYICSSHGWAVCAVDGRGWHVYDAEGQKLPDKNVLDYWEQSENKVAFIGNPESMSYGLTLTAASVIVFYDNSFKTVKRLQTEDRIHRLSMNIEKGATIVDILHLPVDQLVIDTLRNNKKLELLSLAAVGESLGIGENYESDIDLDPVVSV